MVNTNFDSKADAIVSQPANRSLPVRALPLSFLRMSAKDFPALRFPR